MVELRASGAEGVGEILGSSKKFEPADFLYILKQRIERIQFNNFSYDSNICALLLKGETFDSFGRPKYIVAINTEIEDQEQQKSLVHEIVHIHLGITGNLFEKHDLRVTQEDLIENISQKFYVENSEIVSRVFGSLAWPFL